MAILRGAVVTCQNVIFAIIPEFPFNYCQPKYFIIILSTFIS